MTRKVTLMSIYYTNRWFRSAGAEALGDELRFAALLVLLPPNQTGCAVSLSNDGIGGQVMAVLGVPRRFGPTCDLGYARTGDRDLRRMR